MTINQMRMHIADAYPNENWKRKCENMPDNQVIAIFHSLQNREQRVSRKQQYKQLDIFDVWGKEVLNGYAQ